MELPVCDKGRESPVIRDSLVSNHVVSPLHRGLKQTKVKARETHMTSFRRVGRSHISLESETFGPDPAAQFIFNDLNNHKASNNNHNINLNFLEPPTPQTQLNATVRGTMAMAVGDAEDDQSEKANHEEACHAGGKEKRITLVQKGDSQNKNA
ncbi:hypothetical protein HAX54_047144 [Datura stramonium]|uniref:Uncharacterized protein n=1 Tax=Datura stramonium TaxID=4076 RepID=A0ABS8WK81_DATST|nr:hypothetical protein [Datura stramonium]